MEELQLIKGLDESLPAEASQTTHEATMDIDGGIGEMTGIEGLMLSCLQDTADIEVEARDVDMGEGSGEADEWVKAWNTTSIDAMASDCLLKNRRASGKALLFLASTYYDHLVSTVRDVSETLRENE